jgi:hypothetical protein
MAHNEENSRQMTSFSRKEGELDEKLVCRNFRHITQPNGKFTTKKFGISEFLQKTPENWPG